jgi:hypothetical protein
VIACPVCEHQQADRAECEVCGRSLLSLGAVDAPVAPLEGLEPTLAAPEPFAGAGETMAELEPTLQASAGEVALERVAELEPTAAAPVEASGELVPDLEPTSAAASLDPRSELPLFPVCRYCRTSAGPGERICARCGMQLPLGPAHVTAASAGPRLCSCGAPITRSTCPACGARNKAE